MEKQQRARVAAGILNTVTYIQPPGGNLEAPQTSLKTPTARHDSPSRRGIRPPSLQRVNPVSFCPRRLLAPIPLLAPSPHHVVSSANPSPNTRAQTTQRNAEKTQ